MCFHVSVGNKNDDPSSKVVETTDAQKFAEQMGISLFETSAKENINVEEVRQLLLGVQSVTEAMHFTGVHDCVLISKILYK